MPALLIRRAARPSIDDPSKKSCAARTVALAARLDPAASFTASSSAVFSRAAVAPGPAVSIAKVPGMSGDPAARAVSVTVVVVPSRSASLTVTLSPTAGCPSRSRSKRAALPPGKATSTSGFARVAAGSAGSGTCTVGLWTLAIVPGATSESSWALAAAASATGSANTPRPPAEAARVATRSSVFWPPSCRLTTTRKAWPSLGTALKVALPPGSLPAA